MRLTPASLAGKTPAEYPGIYFCTDPTVPRLSKTGTLSGHLPRFSARFPPFFPRFHRAFPLGAKNAAIFAYREAPWFTGSE